MGQTGKVWLSGVWYALTAERPAMIAAEVELVPRKLPLLLGA